MGFKNKTTLGFIVVLISLQGSLFGGFPTLLVVPLC